ncbi:MAG: hypothetical protein F2832_03150 [Actinobacteria bacterium]|nr:hypothetical protein [Actinomycetota bacterium]
MTGTNVTVRDPHELPDGPLRLLAARAVRADRADGARLALSIEGGGLATSMAAGIAHGLQQLGLLRWVDVVYGTSSGSLVALYAATGRMSDAAHILEAACTRAFIDLRRVGRRPVVDLEHLLGLSRARPPALEVDQRPEARVLAVGVEDGVLRTYGPLTALDDAHGAVRASMSIPFWAGPPSAHDGALLADGGLVESIPVATPLREGATHVLALRSRDARYRKGAPSRFARLVQDPIVARLAGEIPCLVRERPARYDAEAQLLECATAGQGDHAGRVAQLAPAPGTPLVGRLQTDPLRVRGAFSAGTRVALDALARRA